MNVAIAGFRGIGWSDLAFTTMTGGWCGSSSDDLMAYQDPSTQPDGDAAMYGAIASNQILVSQNNQTEADREDYTGDAERSRLIYSRPRTYSEWLNRFVCSATGMMAGGQDKVVVDGRPYIRKFAPRLGRSARWDGDNL